MGGLIHRMPVTAVLFLFKPPSNGGNRSLRKHATVGMTRWKVLGMIS